ncbi:MAG: hypothetical protein HYV60_07550 [Planctomycetia bacterium]|nr:hypothetical protein [Planctomycetia bacterium]
MHRKALEPIRQAGQREHEKTGAASEQRTAYWVHEEILPELARWLRIRIFPISEIVGCDR